MERVASGLRLESQWMVKTERKKRSEDGSRVAFVSEKQAKVVDQR